MTIPVDPADLGKAMLDYRHAYLLTTGTDGIIKVNGVDAHMREHTLFVPMRNGGMQARLNIAANPTVTVVWPPLDPEGYTLIADGTAASDEAEIRIDVAQAILHLPTRAEGTPRCDE